MLWPRLGALIHHAHYIDQQRVVRQRGAQDCGVAVLEMVLPGTAALGVSLDSLRSVLQVRRRGLSFAELRTIVEGQGGHAAGWQLQFSALSGMAMPLIAQWPDHFVVVDSVTTSGEVIVRDPAFGRMRMSRGAFLGIWTGRVLEVFAPYATAP
jgi:ABC-type bacteriocin/lantibiotic exporter with double-glycine peptidase domain